MLITYNALKKFTMAELQTDKKQNKSHTRLVK